MRIKWLSHMTCALFVVELILRKPRNDERERSRSNAASETEQRVF